MFLSMELLIQYYFFLILHFTRIKLDLKKDTDDLLVVTIRVIVDTK